jgi:demethylmenaquinone methyltransferase/2-methoxy-6-polyprenyl-1,4-benzoquinol methylase
MTSEVDLDKVPGRVAAMFDRVADRYDLTNDILSAGQDRMWRQRTVRALDVSAGQRVLDLAAGTGTSSHAIAFGGPGVVVVPCDISMGMLAVGKRRRPELDFVAGNATALPFADESFDAVTISFGLRNVEDTDGALREMLRVTKPGGRLVVCEFSTPTNPTIRTIYMNYLMRALPPIAAAVTRDEDSYRYLAESIRQWPDQDALGRLIAAAGWARPAFQNLSGGIVALHRAFKAE